MRSRNVIKGILSAQQEAFIAGLVAGKSQREAYYAAFPVSRSWKESTVDSKACTLANDEKVKERYSELCKLAAKPIIDDAIKIKGEIIDTQLAILRANIGDIYKLRNNDGKTILLESKDQAKLDQFDMRAVKSYRYDREGNLILELHDKQPAIDCLRELFNLAGAQEKEEIKIVLQGAEDYAD